MQLNNLTKKELINIIYKKENEIEELQRKYNKNQMKMTQLSKNHEEGLELIEYLSDENKELKEENKRLKSYQKNVEALIKYKLLKAHKECEHIEYKNALKNILSDIENNVYL